MQKKIIDAELDKLQGNKSENDEEMACLAFHHYKGARKPLITDLLRQIDLRKGTKLL